ncbi:hypothetical protein Tsp_07405 [Trichinella spiralis]|uniref:hypothetical protein n=1 Tax=Trichinella spiralis TaxID=6334 RepID=UPI0001EFCB42|nr:hypothetical protein Tsp_07405 [Trichinella spiralis]
MDANEMHKIFTWYHRQCLSLTPSPRLEVRQRLFTIRPLEHHRLNQKKIIRACKCCLGKNRVLRKELEHHLPLYQNERNSSHEEASAAGDVPSAAHGEAIDAGNAPKLAL